MSPDQKIRQLLESRLADWADEQCQPLRIAYQNVKFEPPANEPYLRVYILRAKTAAPDLAGQMRTRLGILQVNVVGVEHEGPRQAEEIAGLLEELFPANLRLTDDEGFAVQIIEPGSFGPALPGDGRYMQPISFSYRSDVLIAP